jgi:hypothetical protein
MLVATGAAAETEEGWSAGAGGKVYGGARSACDAFLKETQSGGVTYVVDRMEPTAGGDQACWFKNSQDKEPSVTQTLIYRVRRTSYAGVAIFRGTTKALRREHTKLEHDLGPGIYYYKEQWVARAYAQGAFLQASTPDKPAPDAVVLDHDFKAPKEVMDFSQGKLLAEFEKVACKELTPDYAERMFDGEVNPAHYYKAFVAFAKTKQKKPADWKVVIGPDYRHSIAGNGQQDPELNCDTKPEDRSTRRQPQIRINDKTMTNSLDGKAMVSLEARFPSKEDVAASLVGHATNQLFGSCQGTAKTAACASWPQMAGRLIFLRRGWQSVPHYVKGPKGNHWHLRIGDVLIDGAFMQFDRAAANTDQGELFVGTRAELVQRLDNFTKPIYDLDGAKLVTTYWDAPPFKAPDGRIPRLGYRTTSAKPMSVGEAVWDPDPSN